ncbi:MAG: hypothetical protein ACE5K3_01000 [bacterium]
MAAATIWNAKITRDLLRQSKAAFESDVFRRIVFSTLQLDAQLRIAGKSERGPYIVGLAVGMLRALEKSDPSTYRKTRETMEVWSKSEEMKGPKGIFREALKKSNEK